MADEEDPMQAAKKLLAGAYEVKLEPVDEKEVNELVNSIMSEVKQKEINFDKASTSEEKPKVDVTQAKENYAKGQRFAKLAVDADKKELFGTAAKNYDESLVCFANSLYYGFPQSEDKINFLINTMTTYLDRLQELIIDSEVKNFTTTVCTEKIPAIGALNLKRRKVMTVMAEKGTFQALSRGVELKKRAKIAEEKSYTWEAFVLYSESLDCLMVYLSTLKEDNKKQKKPVMEAINKILESAERLKSELREI